uniref:Uncharacterized protein n=1 Tax=Octactis speculum TaxID=3111310 RepID=A0A7S2ANT5_9STRA
MEQQITATELAFNPHALKVTKTEDKVGWYFYKVAIPVSKRSTEGTWQFLTDLSGGHSCSVVDLGCEGRKMSCAFGFDDAVTEIHFVVAPDLFAHARDHDDLGEVGWEKIQQSSFGVMDSFTPFMHNKVQIFTTDINKVIRKLEVNGYNVMKRLSVYEDGWAAHASIGIVGKVWEFVGFPPNNLTEFSPWAPEECPFAHRVDANMSMMYENAVNQNPNDPRSFWISTHVATSTVDTDGFKTLFGMLKNQTGALISTHDDHEYCKVVTVDYTNEESLSNGGKYGDDISLRFIHNWNYQSLKKGNGDLWYSVRDYEEYISRVHERYLSHSSSPGEKATDQWRNWDHWLDQHIGIAWAETEGCTDKNKDITEALLAKDIYLGERDAAGDHFYTAYEDVSMAVEYSTATCSHGKGVPNVCTCSKLNSNLLANTTECAGL